MATPLRFKYKWPSQPQQQSGTDVSDFVPYISNLANMFTRTPNPQAPTLVNPVVGQKISLANSRSEVGNATRAADLATQGLDAQTGAAVRVGNMANKLRSLSDINSREAVANAQTANQTNMINANIEAQNAGQINQYHDELTNAQLTRSRLASENLSNAADKYIGQKAADDQRDLEKEKANILSKMYTPGVYSRLLDKLKNTGTDTSNMGTPTTQQTSPFDKFRNMQLPPYTGQSGAPVTNPITSPSTDETISMDTMPKNVMGSLRKFMKQRGTYAAGGMMDMYSGDPTPTPVHGGHYYTTNTIDRNANFIDGMNKLVANGIDPFSSQAGQSLIRGEAATFYNPEFATGLGTRIKAFQSDPGYAGMTPQQRVMKFYQQSGQKTPVDQFLQNTSHYGGNPGAFYEGSHMKAAGGDIHINPANKGKFTASANAAGMGVQEYAAHVLASDSASPLQKKRANFARNAAKWNRAYGGKMVKPFC